MQFIAARCLADQTREAVGGSLRTNAVVTTLVVLMVTAARAHGSAVQVDSPTARPDRQQLQELWCAQVRDVSWGMGVDRLRVVGGWFGIRALQELLKPEHDRRFDRWRPQGGDDLGSFDTPRMLSLMALRELLDSPLVDERFNASGSQGDPAVAAIARLAPGVPGISRRIRLSQAEEDLAVKKLNDWISQHKDDLEKLEPTGEGVDFSEKACRDGRPVDR